MHQSRSIAVAFAAGTFVAAVVAASSAVDRTAAAAAAAVGTVFVANSCHPQRTACRRETFDLVELLSGPVASDLGGLPSGPTASQGTAYFVGA